MGILLELRIINAFKSHLKHIQILSFEQFSHTHEVKNWTIFGRLSLIRIFPNLIYAILS
jgi:hypothetical protein